MAGHHVVRIGIISASSTRVRAIQWFVPNKWLVDLHGTKGVCTKLSPQLAEGPDYLAHMGLSAQWWWQQWNPSISWDQRWKMSNTGYGSCGFLLKRNACSMGSVCFSLGVRIHSSISKNPIFLEDALYHMCLFEHGWVMSTVLLVGDPAGHS